MSEPWVPTIDDLRVKLCYICREEETYDKPEDPPRVWTHPCNCTLVAHESCLLHWIKAAQQNPDRAANALKCPQCGAHYELDSYNPRPLRLLDAINRGLSRVGKIVTITCVGITTVSFGGALYVVFTSYGVYAVRCFLGKDMFDALLTDEPSNWPWHAFINLPLIPISLIASRTPIASAISPLIPLLFAWPPTAPQAGLAGSWPWRGSDSWLSSTVFPNSPARYWPPSPTLVCALFPFVKSLYNLGLRRLTRLVVNSHESPQGPLRRVEWALNDEGGAAGFLRIRIQQHDDGPPANQDNAAGAPPPLRAAGENPDHAEVDENAVDENDAGVAAERTIRLTGGSIGRAIGGALILPRVSGWMGSLLLRLSAYFPILSKILAARPPLSKTLPIWSPSLPRAYPWHSGDKLHEMKLMFKTLWQGSRVWTESDPVWWRNLLGLGIFVVAKDAIKLLHLWYAKQEVESRRVKNRSFEGVDIKNLDLINPSRR